MKQVLKGAKFEEKQTCKSCKIFLNQSKYAIQIKEFTTRSQIQQVKSLEWAGFSQKIKGLANFDYIFAVNNISTKVNQQNRLKLVSFERQEILCGTFQMHTYMVIVQICKKFFQCKNISVIDCILKVDLQSSNSI
ncbi:hypothetical protein ABPG74_013357 [Tetrahymena malaccensis]